MAGDLSLNQPATAVRTKTGQRGRVTGTRGGNVIFVTEDGKEIVLSPGDVRFERLSSRQREDILSKVEQTGGTTSRSPTRRDVQKLREETGEKGTLTIGEIRQREAAAAVKRRRAGIQERFEAVSTGRQFEGGFTPAPIASRVGGGFLFAETTRGPSVRGAPVSREVDVPGPLEFQLSRRTPATGTRTATAAESRRFFAERQREQQRREFEAVATPRFPSTSRRIKELEKTFSPTEAFALGTIGSATIEGGRGVRRGAEGLFQRSSELGLRAASGDVVGAGAEFGIDIIAGTLGIPFRGAQLVGRKGIIAGTAATAGEVAPSAVAFAIGGKIGRGVAARAPKPRIVELRIAETAAGKTVDVAGLKDILTTDAPRGARTVQVFGFEAGSRALPVVSRTRAGFSIGGPKLAERVQLGGLAKPVPAPATALEFGAVRDIFELTPAERARAGATVKAGRELFKEPGLSVEEFVPELGSLKRPRRAGKIFEEFIAEEEGVLFGTATSQQLPRGLRVVPGDIDVIFPGSRAALEPGIAGLAKRLRGAGEDVRVSARKPTILETPKGEKIFEAKTAEDALGGDVEVAQTGFAGMEFGNLRRGDLGDTVRFGKARAIRAGEQFVRKGAASTFFRPRSGRAPGPFRDPGLFPLGKRTPKDISGFLISGRGLAELKSRRGILARRSARRASQQLDRFFESFTKEQQELVRTDIGERLLGDGGEFKFEIGKLPKRRPGSISISRRSPSISGFRAARSPLRIISPSPRVRTRSPSPPRSVSPRPRSPSLPSPRPRSISPRPRSRSPVDSSFIGRSPSPPGRSFFKSPGTPRSPSLSPPSPGSPSPPVSPSPSLIAPPSNRIFGLPAREFGAPFKRRRKRKTKRRAFFTPSVTAAQLDIVGKPPKVDVGAIRPAGRRKKLSGRAALDAGDILGEGGNKPLKVGDVKRLL